MTFTISAKTEALTMKRVRNPKSDDEGEYVYNGSIHNSSAIAGFVMGTILTLVALVALYSLGGIPCPS